MDINAETVLHQPQINHKKIISSKKITKIWLLNIGFLLFFLSIHIAASAQNFRISGTVKNKEGISLGHAIVQINDQKVLANEQGFYELADITTEEVNIRVQMIGFETYNTSVKFKSPDHILHIILQEKKEVIEEVQVKGLTKVQELNRQAFNISVVDATKQYNSSINLSDALDKVTGIRVRESGGLGSNMNLSLNGFSGNHVRIFIDGIPMDNMGSSYQINNIPINLAERIEVYKGVVPIWLGSDALGGAINIVSGSGRRNYVDVSYGYGSFNTHRAVVNAAFTAKSGLTFQLNAYQNYSDNSYKVYIEQHNNRKDGYTKDTYVNRFHDTYHNETIIGNVGFGDKSFADKLLLGVVLGQNYKEMQTGARMESVFGGWHRRGNIVMPTLKYSKNNLLKGLDVIFNANINLGTEQNIDTLNKRFDWFGDTGAVLPITSGERSRSMYKYKNNEGIVTSNLNYSLLEHHSISLNHVFNTFNRKGSDPLNPQNDAYESPQRSRKHVLGIGYQFQQAGVWNINVFTKFIQQNNLGRNNTNSNSQQFGYGTALTYFLTDAAQLKASYELTNRMATPYEIFGDVENQEANESLKPEQSNNFNLGFNYSFSYNKSHDFQLSTSLIYRHAKDFIYQRLNLNQSKYVADNRAGVRTFGGDFDLRYSYKNWLKAGNSWTYHYLQNMQEFEEGYTGISPVYKDQMPNIPYFFGNTDVSVLFKDVFQHGHNLTVGYNNLYVHQFYLYWPSRGALKNDIPKQWTHDMNCVYSLKNGAYNIGLEVRNITNEQVFDNFSMQKPGRAFYLNFRYFIKK